MSRLKDGPIGLQVQPGLPSAPKERAVAICQRYSGIPGIRPPYQAGTFTWQCERYCHVIGLGDDGQRHLVEVFRICSTTDLEPVLAFRYPPPIAQWFPAEYGVLHGPDLWGDGVVPVALGVLADGLREFNRPASKADM